MYFLCFKIFISRILDVTLSSIRTLFIVKCNKVVASIISFLEIFIWFYAAKSALISNESSICIVISYALGYSLGTFIGTAINSYFISGVYSIKVNLKNITKQEEMSLKNISLNFNKIRDNNTYILFIDVNKNNYKELLNKISLIDEDAFIVVNETLVK